MNLRDYTQEQVKILLIYPDYFEGQSYNKSNGGNYSEGLASISATVKSGGHWCELLHLRHEHDEHEFKNKLREFDCDISFLQLNCIFIFKFSLFTFPFKEFIHT